MKYPGPYKFLILVSVAALLMSILNTVLISAQSETNRAHEIVDKNHADWIRHFATKSTRPSAIIEIARGREGVN